MEQWILKHLLQNEHTEIDKAKLTHGIRILLSDSYKLLAVYGVALILNCWLEVFVMHITFYTLRQVSLGYHFTSNITCVISSVLLFPILCKLMLVLNFKYDEPLFLVSLLVILVLAPVGTIKNPVINRRHRTYLKKSTISRVFIVFVLYQVLPGQIKVLVALGVFVQSLMLLVQLIINKSEGIQ